MSDFLAFRVAFNKENKNCSIKALIIISYHDHFHDY